MTGTVMQILGGVLLAISAVELQASGDGSKGAEKKAQAVAKFQGAVTPLLPAWAVPLVAAFLPVLIDVAVAWANSTGFFAQFAAASPTSPGA